MRARKLNAPQWGDKQMRKLSTTEFDFISVYSTADLEFTKKGLEIEKDDNNLISWKEIEEARREVGLVSFSDEEFEQYAREQGYYKFVPVNPKGDAMTDPARAIADLFDRLDTQRMEVLSMLMIWARDCVLPDDTRMVAWAEANGYVRAEPKPDEPTLNLWLSSK